MSEIYICQEDEWFNAFGETKSFFHIGARLTLTDTKYVGGLRFLQFVEAPKDHWYEQSGFKSLKGYN